MRVGRLFLNFTNLLVAQDIKLGEVKRLHFEFNMINLFNQKTARYQQNIVTRYRDASSAIDLSNTNLLNGYNWQQLLSQTEYAQNSAQYLPDSLKAGADPNSLNPTKNWAVDPTCGQFNQFNPGFSARFGVKFIF